MPLTGTNIPTTYEWDVDQLQSVSVTSPEFKELLVRLYQNINNVVLALNVKDSGYYDVQEDANGQLFFPLVTNSLTSSINNYRPIIRKVIDFGALPNATTKTVAHGITILATTLFTRIYGCASDPSTSFIPIPFSSPTLNQNIRIEVDVTDVIITTAIDYSGYTSTYVILEYLHF